jgi:hypothetical protein
VAGRWISLTVAGVALVALTGCASSHPAGGAGPNLVVHIGLFGGPATRTGGMALSNSPGYQENVTAIDASGRRQVARTDNAGVARLRVDSGRYTVYSTYCGVGRQHAVVVDGRVTRVQISCPVP